MKGGGLVITAGVIPQITGDLDACYSHGFMVSVLGSRFADTGSAVMRSWSGLSGVYVAPESGVLLAAMVPVAFTAGGVGADLNATGSAIMAYATAVRPIKARLQGLVSEASEFVAYASAHDNWDTDQSRVDQHNAMLTEVNDLMARWEAAERSCANTVDALYGGTQYGVNNGDGTASANEYGLTAELWGSVAAGEEGVPWGTAAGRDKPWYADVGDAVGGFFVGVGRGVTGLVTGLGGFVGFQGWDVMGRSWKGLGALAIVAVSPQVMVSGQGFPGYQPGEIQATVTGMGKGLIAYDQWASDPAQAAGESVFNIAPFFIPVGGAAAGTAKAVSLAGKTAGVVGVAGRAAKVADVLKASRVADVVAGVRTTVGLRLSNAANALHTALGGPDRALAGPGRRHLPEAPVPHTPDLHAPDLHADAPPAPHPADPVAPHPRPEVPTASSELRSVADRAAPEVRAHVAEVMAATEPKLQRLADDLFTRANDPTSSRWVEYSSSHGGRPPSPAVVGTWTHTEFEAALRVNSGRDILDPATGYRLRVEVSYDANGLPAVRGSSGSIRPDVVLSREFVNPQGVQTWQPVHIYDFKTGLRGISGS